MPLSGEHPISERLMASTVFCKALWQLMRSRRAVQFFVLRKLIEHAWVRKGYDHKHAYICSLSSHTIVYKGQLLPAQVTSQPHNAYKL